MCGTVFAILYVVVLVVCKDVLLFAHNHALVASHSQYLEVLWTATVVFEMVLGIVYTVCKTLCENKESITHTLAIILALLDLILQATLSYILYETDLCKSAEVEHEWIKRVRDVQWMATLLLILFGTICNYAWLCPRYCSTKHDFSLISYIVLTMLLSGTNIYRSYKYECNLV